MNAPKMVIVDGLPVSEWDVAGKAAYGCSAGAERHYVPHPTRRGAFVVRATVVLYAEDRAKPGRPLRFSLTDARHIKRAYWTGEKTIKALAREYECTTVTIGRIVHGHTMWYVECM